MTDSAKTWHLLGLGAIGCLYTAYWQRAGVAIQPLLRDDNALRELHAAGGIALQRGDETTTIAVAAATPLTCRAPIERLVICTKAYQTLTAVDAVKRHLSAQPLVILLQNGMGVRELLLREIPGATILHALCTEGAYRTARFAVTHAGRGTTSIGAIDARDSTQAEAAANALQCELSIAYAADIERQLWLKLAVNAVINPLTALYRCRNGELLQLTDIDANVAALCDELALVASAEKIAVDTRELSAAVYRVMRDTAGNRSSMLQDVEAGRRSEIDFINGFIVQRAHAHGISCPRHAELLERIRALDARALSSR